MKNQEVPVGNQESTRDNLLDFAKRLKNPGRFETDAVEIAIKELMEEEPKVYLKLNDSILKLSSPAPQEVIRAERQLLKLAKEISELLLQRGFSREKLSQRPRLKSQT